MNCHFCLSSRRKSFALLFCAGFITAFPWEAFANNKLQETQVVQQQKQTVSGIVKDVSGESIIGANVMEKGTANGVITDLDGGFSLSVSPNATLIISYIGYITQEVKAESRSIKITLMEDSKTLDEVVVVGFGTQKKVNLTGAVGTLSGDELQERPVSNATQALQGLMPGLNIDISNGSLESRPSINVRGITTIGDGSSGDPLILIDGMEGELHSINPQDIANISILKDAAASSIYGSRAPFGVILITTKTGSKDGKTTINYNNSFRWGSPINKKEMMNSVQFAAWLNDAQTNAGGGAFFGETWMKNINDYHSAKPYGPAQRITEDGTIVYAINPMTNGQWESGFTSGADDINYYDVVYKNWTFSQEHNVSASGGNDKFNYYASGSYFNQNGLLNIGEDGLDRFTATGKINSQLTNWLKFNLNMRFTREDYTRPSQMTDYFYTSLAAKAWPILPLYDRNGYLFHSDDRSVASLEQGGIDKKQTDFIYMQTGFVLEPIKNWLTSVDFNYRIKSADRHWDRQPFVQHDVNESPYYRNSTSYAHEDLLKENYYNFNARSEYSFSLNDSHHFHVMGGFQTEELKQKWFGLQRDGILIGEKPEIDLTSGLDINGNPITPSVNGGQSSWSTVGFLGRVNYDYKSRYLFEVNVRADGSSRFRQGNQWKTFPSASIGWNIAEEHFFEPLRDIVDMLKIRGSYGTLGNQNTNNWYYTFQTLSVSPSSGGWLQNGRKPNTAWAPGLVSEALTWETVESFNIGFDWGAFRNKLTGSFDYYVRNTLDMVGPAPALPDILGATVPKTNNTDLRTHGWELSVMWRDALKNGLSYSAKFLLSDSRTKILHYPNNPTNSNTTYMEGRYINDIWGYETLGLAKTDEEMQQHLATLPNGGQNALGSDWRAGDIMYKDLDGDRKVSGGSWTVDDPGDRKVIGNSTPRFRFGLDLNATWKGFDMRVFFQGVLKRDYWQGSGFMFGFTGANMWDDCAGLTEVHDYFRNEDTWSVKEGYNTVNLDAYLPRIIQNNGKNTQVQSRYLQDASYVRLKNLQIGYTLPAALSMKWGVQKMRVYFSGENLFTITNLVKQFDPETIGTTAGNGYPLSTTLSCGLSLTF